MRRAIGIGGVCQKKGAGKGARESLLRRKLAARDSRGSRNVSRGRFDRLAVVCRLAVRRDVEPLALFFFRDAQTDCQIDDLEGDIGDYRRPYQRCQHGLRLDPQLAGDRIRIGGSLVAGVPEGEG